MSDEFRNDFQVYADEALAVLGALTVLMLFGNGFAAYFLGEQVPTSHPFDRLLPPALFFSALLQGTAWVVFVLVRRDWGRNLYLAAWFATGFLANVATPPHAGIPLALAGCFMAVLLSIAFVRPWVVLGTTGMAIFQWIVALVGWVWVRGDLSPIAHEWTAWGTLPVIFLLTSGVLASWGVAIVNRICRRLTAERDRARRSAFAKSVFLNSMSHELRTPLTSVQMAADEGIEILSELQPEFEGLYQSGVVGERGNEQRTPRAQVEVGSNFFSDGRKNLPQVLGTVRTAAHQMETMFSSLLEMSNIEGGLDLNPSPVNVAEAVQAVLEPLVVERKPTSFLASNRNEVWVDLDPNLHLWVDRLRLQQVVEQIVDNALRYNRNGLIHIFGGLRDGVGVLEIQDNGPGIPEDRHEAIFEPFVRTEDSSTQAERGLGLGLPIARKLAQAMGGDVAVESQSNQGALFRVTLPLANRTVDSPLRYQWSGS